MLRIDGARDGAGYPHELVADLAAYQRYFRFDGHEGEGNAVAAAPEKRGGFQGDLRRVQGAFDDEVVSHAGELVDERFGHVSCPRCGMLRGIDPVGFVYLMVARMARAIFVAVDHDDVFVEGFIEHRVQVGFARPALASKQNGLWVLARMHFEGKRKLFYDGSLTFAELVRGI